MKTGPQPKAFQEPIRQTLRRTVMIAVVVGAVIALSSRRLSNLLPGTVLALWPSFGGHWVEVWFLDWVRPRLPSTPCFAPLLA